MANERIGGTRKAIVCVSRLLLVVAVVLALPISSPATVQAATNPVDLVLGGEGATSWNITNVQPGDNGTKEVTLHNAGTKDGFVTIWLSDIVSTEGTSPEFATANTTEPGELIDSLQLGISCNRTGTNINLPTTISNFPRSVSDPKYIEVIPLKANDTANLTWQWELPVQTGNKAQGDGVSFTITYLLTECQITDVSSVVDNQGVFTENVTATTEGGNGKVVIGENTTGQTQEGQPLSEIWLIDISKDSTIPSPDKVTVGPQYDAGPHGTTFDQPVTLTLTYNPDDIPARASAEDLAIARWDENAGMWVELGGSTVDPVNDSISVSVNHFSRYTIISPAPPIPPPTGFFGGGGSPVRPVISPEKKETPKTILETDISGYKQKIETEADGTLLKPLKLTEPGGRFLIEVDAGGKITSRDGIPITRLELSVSGESIVVPEDIVILSPIYKIAGYINEVETSPLTFMPSARLTILYDPKNLPENVLAPFVAFYTSAQTLVPLEPPPGTAFEIGKATAEISHASLFFVAAKLVPPPLPLPPKFAVSNLIISPRQGSIGQSVIINLEIANDGETAGSYQLQLKIDGIVRAVKEITLAAKSTEKVSFEIQNLSVGEHDVEVAGLSGNFRIVSTAVLPSGQQVDWATFDLTIGAVVTAALLTLYLFRKRL